MKDASATRAAAAASHEKTMQSLDELLDDSIAHSGECMTKLWQNYGHKFLYPKAATKVAIRDFANWCAVINSVGGRCIQDSVACH